MHALQTQQTKAKKALWHLNMHERYRQIQQQQHQRSYSVCVYRGSVRHVPVNKSNTLCLSVVLVTLLLHWLWQVKITLIGGSDLYIYVTSVPHYKMHRSDADSDWTSHVQSRYTMLINDAGDWSYWQTQTNGP